MTTGLQIAILGGALLATGVVLLIWRLMPARADLADVVRRNSPAGAKAQAEADALAESGASRTERLGVWALKRFPTSWWGTPPTKELAILQVPLHRYYGEKVIFGLVGLAFPAVVGYFLAVMGMQVSFGLPLVASLALGAALFFLPDLNARDDAKKARKEFSHALGAYTDLVALERLGGSGARQAMELAAEVGDSWVFRRLSEELARSRWNGKAPWDALNALADELGLPELTELADIMRLSKEGSQVYTQLRARSEGIRTANLNAELAKSNSTSERLTIPATLLAMVFVLVMVTPSLLSLASDL
ncbi:hypothetical protein ACQFYA_21035 [Promicromonospora sp. Marseille-Q5078]